METQSHFQPRGRRVRELIVAILSSRPGLTAELIVSAGLLGWVVGCAPETTLEPVFPPPGAREPISVVEREPGTGRPAMRSPVEATTQMAQQRAEQAQPSAQPSAQDAAALRAAGRFVMGYYHDPQPQRVPEIIDTMARTGFLSMAGGEVGPAAGFLRAVFAANPDKLDEWAKGWADLPIEDRITLATMLWAADTDAARQVLESMKTGAPEELAGQIQSLQQFKPTPLVELEFRSPAVLDALWGAWFATGDAKYVRRITEALALLEAVDQKQIEAGNRPTRQAMYQFVIGRTAQWSLTSNAVQDAAVLEALKAALPEANEKVKPHLEEIIETAQAQRAAEGS